MNRIILLILTVLLSIPVQSQEDNVVIDGVTFSADRKTLISYPKDKIDVAYTVPEGTEIIGEDAFFNFSDGHLKALTLPRSLKEIQIYGLASCCLESITWQTYPDIFDMYIFGYENSNIATFYSSDNSTNCVAVDGVLYSKDRKKLLRFPIGTSGRYWIDYEVQEGVEVIGARAFEGGKIETITLPASLVRIEDNAFEMVERIPTRDYYGYMCVMRVVCNAVIPPAIVGNPFVTPYKIVLEVPEESSKSYWNTPYWNSFGMINGDRWPASIDSQEADPGLQLTREGGLLYLKSERKIVEVMIYNTSGVCVWRKYVNSNDCQLETFCLPKGILFLEVTSDPLKKKVYKLID